MAPRRPEVPLHGEKPRIFYTKETWPMVSGLAEGSQAIQEDLKYGKKILN